MEEEKRQRFWIVGHDLVFYDSYPNVIGNQLDKNKQPKTPKFGQLSKDDLIVYYAFPEKALIGIFKIVSDKQTEIHEKEDAVKKNSIYYSIDPLYPIDYFVDITKLSLLENNFETFPKGLVKEKFPQTHICEEITNNDFSKFRTLLQKKEYAKVFSEENKIAIFSSLLEFYGNRSTSFVNLFVASIFGIVTLSAVIQFLIDPIILALSFFPFLVFSVAGYYTLERYFYYVNWTEQVKTCLEFPNRYALYKRLTYDDKTNELELYPEFVQRVITKKSHIKNLLNKRASLPIAYILTLVFLGLTVYLNALFTIYKII